MSRILQFEALTLAWKDTVTRYMYQYGGGSCQHSFAAMYCLEETYDSRVCEKDGWLYILRARLCTDMEKVYLFPMGDYSDRRGLVRAIRNLLADACADGKTLRFETLTAGAWELLEALFPGRFTAVALRDSAEYIYTREKLTGLAGHALKKRRNALHAFYRRYSGRADIRELGKQDFAAVRSFQRGWLEKQGSGERRGPLEREDRAICRALDAYEALGLSGIVVYIDGSLKGYTIGAGITAEYYDAMFEKGDRDICDIYRVLSRDTARLCCGRYTYINREEDVGDPGLRKVKMSYRPDILLEKFRVREVRE